MKKILLIGNGGREHAIGEALKRSPQGVELAVLGTARNPGLVTLVSEYRVGDIKDKETVVKFAKEFGADFVFIGPEAPLEAGVVDALAGIGIPSVGSTRQAARIETSKSFARQLLKEADIKAYPKFKVCDRAEDIEGWIKEISGGTGGEADENLLLRNPSDAASWSNSASQQTLSDSPSKLEFVVKPDGLTGGKGVKVQGDHFQTAGEGVEYALQCLARDGRVVLEEKLQGQEFSLMSFSDGEHLVHLPVVQDNKRLLAGDNGPNTGGMGSVSDSDHSLPFLTSEDIRQAQQINEQVIRELKIRGLNYKGILYGNYIAVKEGIKLIEYNARFGDPEAMNVLSILESDFVAICQAIINQKLDYLEVKFANQATVCKYLVPEGYPEKPIKDEKIEIGGIDDNKVKIYYAAVDQREGGDIYLTGSRAIALVGVAETMSAAERLVEAEIQKIKGPLVHRADIGTEELMNKRIAMLRELRK